MESSNFQSGGFLSSSKIVYVFPNCQCLSALILSFYYFHLLCPLFITPVWQNLSWFGFLCPLSPCLNLCTCDLEDDKVMQIHGQSIHLCPFFISFFSFCLKVVILNILHCPQMSNSPISS